MRSSKKNLITLHERLFRDIAHHIEETSFNSVSAFVHHVMADIVSTGDFAKGGDISAEEAELVRKRLEVLGYIEATEAAPLIQVHGGLKEPVNRQVHRGLVKELVEEAREPRALRHLGKGPQALLPDRRRGALAPRGPHEPGGIPSRPR